MKAAGAAGQVLVWPLWLRLMHGLLAVAVVVSFITHEGGGVWHERWGWLAVGLATVRLGLGLGPGLGGSRHLKPGDHRHTALLACLRGPRAVAAYARALLRGRAPRHLGHNPLGGWMMLLLLANVLLCSFSGWLFTTDRYWGVAWVEELHGLLGHAFIPLVLLHVVGAVVASVKQRENLVASMVHGRKRAPGPEDVA